MDSKELRQLFPKTLSVLPSHRKMANDLGGQHKLGEILLYSFIPEEDHSEIFWGLSIGTVKGVKIKTEYTEENGKSYALYLDNSFTGDTVTFEIREGKL